MLNIKHTICPSCSVGCGINIISKKGDVLGTYPYKRHPINEGKNCLNGRNSIIQCKNKIKEPSLVKNKELVESDIETILDTIQKELSGINPNELAIICSGKNTNEDIKAAKEFAKAYGTENIGFNGYNFPNNEEESGKYDDINTAETIIAIGDIIKENPLIGRRIILSKKNEGKLIGIDTVDKSITALNSDKYVKTDTITDFITNFPQDIKDKLNENSIILINKIENKENFEVLKEIAKETNAKLLPILKESNSKGAMNELSSLNSEEIKNILENSKVTIVINDNLLDYLSETDIKGKSFIINISNFENEFTKLSDLVIPGKPWSEKSGTFTNNEGLIQEFEESVEDPENNNLSEIEIFEKLAQKLGIN